MQTKKKVLILGKMPPPYMGPSVAFEILVNSGLKDHFNLLSLDIKANTSFETLGKWSFKKVFSNLGIYKKLYSILRMDRPDVVLIPISQSGMGFFKDSVFILLCRFTGTKCLIQLRGSDFKRWVDQSSLIMRMYVRRIMKMTNGVLVLGNNLKYLFKDYFEESRIYVVPNGADYQFQEVPSAGNARVKIIYLANLQPSKGIEDLISAMVILERELPGSCSLDVIGAWRKETTKLNCMQLVEQHKLPVTFFPPESGHVKMQHLQSGDIFVFAPRDPEGHPWVIIEAMAAGLPVISTDQGAITESVYHGKNGFIVPVKDPQAIAEKLILLIKDNAMRGAMGKMSRQIYLDKFTEAKMTANYIIAFEDAISR